MMPLYWSRNSIPEFTGIPKPERHRIWRDAMTHYGWNWRVLAGPLANAPVIALTLYFYKDVAAAYGFGRPGELTIFIVGMMTGHLLAENALIRALRPEVRRLIGGLCHACGHDLSNAPTTCPNCGRENESLVPSDSPDPSTSPLDQYPSPTHTAHATAFLPYALPTTPTLHEESPATTVAKLTVILLTILLLGTALLTLVTFIITSL